MNTHETKISNTRASDTIAYDEKMDNRERWPAARQQFLCYLKLPPRFVGLFQGALFSFHLVEVSSAQRVRVHAHGLGDVVHDRLRDEHTLQFSANQANNTIAMQNTKQCNVMQARFPNKCSVRIWHSTTYVCSGMVLGSTRQNQLQGLKQGGLLHRTSRKTPATGGFKPPSSTYHQQRLRSAVRSEGKGSQQPSLFSSARGRHHQPSSGLLRHIAVRTSVNGGGRVQIHKN